MMRRCVPIVLLVLSSVWAMGQPEDSGASSSSRTAADAADAADFDIVEADILRLQVAMGSGRIDARNLVERYLARIERDNGRLNAIREVNPGALNRATALDAERQNRGPRGPLHGIPIIVKDNFQTADMVTTAGSELFADFQPERDATQIARLRAAGAIILGKANMHEFALGITAQGSAFGQVSNPYDLSRNAGDGVAAAIAANLAAAGMGTDSCGALRISAAHNSLVTLRGTQGLSSRAGIVPVSHNQDIAGPIARSVSDLALLLDATVGFDSADRQTARSLGQVPDSYLHGLDIAALDGARIGVLEDLLLRDPEDTEVVAVIGSAISQMQAAGAEFERIKAPEVLALMGSRVDGFFVLAHDFRTDMEAYLDAQRDRPVEDVADILARGEHHASIDDSLRLAQAMERGSEGEYLAELQHRQMFREVVLAIMARNRLDALVYPAVRQKAAPLGESQPGSNCRLSANTGLPAIALPAGFTPDGLPVGLELLGPAWSEARLLSLAFSVEHQLDLRRPPPVRPPPINPSLELVPLDELVTPES
jgi:Asp-tRNA(Asn)/Glu-tRNA(Gln) amidotransferase A subunit family amidase